MSKLLDVLLNSNQIKKTLVERAVKFKIPLKYLCNETGVDYKMFMSTYINSTSGDPKHISEAQFLKMLDIVGVEVRFQFVVKNDYDGESEGLRLAEKYEKKRNITFD